MVLWKKESTSDDACYIDLLSSNQVERDNFEKIRTTHAKLQKIESMSLMYRKWGNEIFQARKWAEAMVQYNESICYAPNGSEALGLSYANRSACFLHLKMYDKCLVDIGLAKNANYPPRLMHKLDERKTACLDAMKETADTDNKGTPPQMSYSPNAKFPGMADILEVRTNDEFGNHVVAKRDIDVGKIILLEDAFAFVGHNGCEVICKTCAKTRMSFIPCPNCVDVMFCNAKCMESNNMHEVTCGALYNRGKNLTVETILIAVSAFPNAAFMMKFVEDALATREVDSSEYETDLQEKYRLFLKLFVLPKDMNAVKSKIFQLYELALEIPHIEQFFRSNHEKRFLMHLIGQHYCILSANSFGIPDLWADSACVAMIGTCTSLFNHSCAPNILHIIHGNKMIGYVQRPVKKGEQLFINYFEGKESHRSIGQESLNFECKCSKCVPCWKEEDRIRLRSDESYLFFALPDLENIDFKDDSNRNESKLMLQNWFTKFGRLPWSSEFRLMERTYRICYKEDLSTWDY